MTQFLLNCTDFTQQQLENVSLARGASGVVSLLIMVLILALVITNKAYKSTTQRLFLYYLIIVLLEEGIMAIQIEHYFQYNGQNTVCKLVGFFGQYTSCVLVTFINEIMIYLIYSSYYRLKGRESPVVQSVCLKLSLEWILVSIAILVPIVFTWYPLWMGNYGLNGAVCGIKTVEENCMTTGYWDRVILVVYSYLGSIAVIISTVVLVTMYCRMTFRYHPVQSPRSKKLLQQTLLLSGLVTIAFLIPILLSLLQIAVSLTVQHEVYAISLTSAIGTPLSTLLVPASFLAFTYTTKSAKVEPQNNHRCGCLRHCLNLFRRHSQLEVSPNIESGTSDTSPYPLIELSNTTRREREIGSDNATELGGAQQGDSEDQPLVASTTL